MSYKSDFEKMQEENEDLLNLKPAELLKKYKKPLTRDQISKQIFGKPFKDITLKDCPIVNTRYFSQPGVDKNEGLKSFPLTPQQKNQNWCVANKDTIIEEIDRQLTELHSCPQETCPLSNLEKGKEEALKDLKKFIEGMKW